MAKFQDIVRYYQRYWRISVFSIAMMSAFEVIDLFGPYAIGQILERAVQATTGSAHATPDCRHCKGHRATPRADSLADCTAGNGLYRLSGSGTHSTLVGALVQLGYCLSCPS